MKSGTVLLFPSGWTRVGVVRGTVGSSVRLATRLREVRCVVSIAARRECGLMVKSLVLVEDDGVGCALSVVASWINVGSWVGGSRFAGVSESSCKLTIPPSAIVCGTSMGALIEYE